jgi:hypothetical protein
MSASADPDRVWVSWLLASGARAHVERSQDGAVWAEVSEPSADGTGLLVYVDRDVTPGARYGYRLRTGGTIAGETWVEVPQTSGFALRGLTPNPTRGGPLSVSFSLPRAGTAAVDLVDVTGRVVSRSAWTLGAGSRTQPLPGTDRRAPGVYLVRLSMGPDRAESRVVITR